MRGSNIKQTEGRCIELAIFRVESLGSWQNEASKSIKYEVPYLG